MRHLQEEHVTKFFNVLRRHRVQSLTDKAILKYGKLEIREEEINLDRQRNAKNCGSL